MLNLLSTCTWDSLAAIVDEQDMQALAVVYSQVVTLRKESSTPIVS